MLTAPGLEREKIKVVAISVGVGGVCGGLGRAAPGPDAGPRRAWPGGRQPGRDADAGHPGGRDDRGRRRGRDQHRRRAAARGAAAAAAGP